MKWTILALALLLLPSLALAQTSVAVDINKATLDWTYTQDPNFGTPSQFDMKCGNATGNYTVITQIPNPSARSIAVKSAISGQGNWFCVVAAANQFGESGPSNEVNFTAGTAPNAPSNLVVTGH